MIEAMISIFLLVTLATTVGMMVTARQRSISVAGHDAEATALAREPLEQLYAIKRNDWDELAPFNGYITITFAGGTYTIIPDGNTPPGETIGMFTRTVRVTKGLRNGGVLAESGTEDGNVRFIESVVTWKQSGQPRNITLNTYLTNWDSN